MSPVKCIFYLLFLFPFEGQLLVVHQEHLVSIEVQLLYFENGKYGDDFTFLDRGLVILDSNITNDWIGKIVMDKSELFRLLEKSKPIILSPPCLNWEIDYQDVDSLLTLVSQNAVFEINQKSDDGYLRSKLIITKKIKVNLEWRVQKGMYEKPFKITDDYISTYNCYQGYVWK